MPNLNGTSQEAVIVLEGDNAYIDCKVDDLGNHTLVWKFLNPDQDIDTQGLVLTAGQVRVINNQRYSILHQPGTTYTHNFPISIIINSFN